MGQSTHQRDSRDGISVTAEICTTSSSAETIEWFADLLSFPTLSGPTAASAASRLLVLRLNRRRLCTARLRSARRHSMLPAVPAAGAASTSLPARM
eukprot:1597953-Prymnesium_polylepis.2